MSLIRTSNDVAFERLQRRPHARREGHLGAAFDEDRSHQLPRVGLVVHDENPEAPERRKPTGRHRLRHARDSLPVVRGPFVREGQRHREGRALSRPVALTVHRPAVKLDEMPHDGEPET